MSKSLLARRVVERRGCEVVGIDGGNGRLDLMRSARACVTRRALKNYQLTLEDLTPE
jgi:hypothetical protein